MTDLITRLDDAIRVNSQAGYPMYGLNGLLGDCRAELAALRAQLARLEDEEKLAEQLWIVGRPNIQRDIEWRDLRETRKDGWREDACAVIQYVKEGK